METLTCFSFTCSASPEETQKLLKYSNKILLPPSMLHKINERDDVEFPLFFKVINPNYKINKLLMKTLKSSQCS